jgi:hypothetical protein
VKARLLSDNVQVITTKRLSGVCSGQYDRSATYLLMSD